MNKKLMITGLCCCFVLLSGICYSCSYQNKQAPMLISSLPEEVNSDELALITTLPTQTPIVSDDKEQKNLKDDLNIPDDVQQGKDDTLIYVHICGAINSPGVYQVKREARIVDLIELSGGMKKDAAYDYINQAQKVQDGQRIYIPTKQELEELSTADYMKGELDNPLNARPASSFTSLVNINTASEEELMNLPGIGQAKATSIVDYRTNEGRFQTTTDLMKIPGIKEGLYNKISSYITVN